MTDIASSIVGSRPRRGRLTAVCLILAVCLAACGLIGGGSSSETDPTGELELKKITVAVLPTVEITPLHIAIDEGFFKRRGLDVELKEVGNGNLAVTELAAGATAGAAVAFASYTPVISAKASGALDVKIIADNSFAQPLTAMLMVAQNSSIREPKDLEHKKIAVSAKGTLSDLMVKSVLSEKGVNFDSVSWVEKPIPDIPPALTRGDVDAGMIVEPYITSGGRDSGVMQLIDLGIGTLQDLPFTCYAALAETLTKYPKTMEAFLSGLHEGIALATTDRPKVEEALVKHRLAKDGQVAKLINLVGFNRSTDPQRARRDAELMAKFGLIKGPLDFANDMVVPRADVPVSTRESN